MSAYGLPISPARPRGFTLIELLVVMAIIAVLMGLLIPSLAAAREASRRVQCLSGLRGIGVAMLNYAALHGGDLPTKRALGNYGFRRAPGTRDPSDPRSLKETYGLGALMDAGGHIPGDSKIWVCPSQPRWMRDLGNTYAVAINLTRPAGHGTTRLGPASMPMVWDNHTMYPYVSGFRAPEEVPSGFTIPPDERIYPHHFGVFRKAKAANFLYGDGHACPLRSQTEGP